MTLSTFFTVESDCRQGGEIVLLSGSLATHPVRARHHAPGVGEARRLLREVRSAQAAGAIERRLLLDGTYAIERQSPDTASPPPPQVIRRSPALIEASQLWSVVNDEALLEGPQAVRDLCWFRARYDVASTLLMMRLQSGLTQRRLATCTGIPQDRISDIENGVGNPTLHTLVSLGEALGADVTIRTRGRPAAARPVV
jgi:DNA-binding XRE family transcriptional regulator